MLNKNYIVINLLAIYMKWYKNMKREKNNVEKYPAIVDNLFAEVFLVSN